MARAAGMASEVEIPDATAITPWLYVGAQESVALERRDLLVEKGVTHVVSVQKVVGAPWLVGKAGNHPPPFQHLHVKIEDTLTANISSHFSEIDAFLTNAKTTNGKTIVHCAFGVSRSVTVACAHLMLSCEKSLGEALEVIVSKRPHANPNKSFLAALVQLEIELLSKSSNTDKAPSDLRNFPSLPKHWAFIEWPCPLWPQTTKFISCHGRLMKVKRVSERPKLFVVSNFLTAVETEAIVETAAPELHPSLVVKHDVVGKLAGIFVAKSDRNKDDGAEDDDNTNSKTKSTGEVSSGRTSWNCRVSATHPVVRGAIRRASFLSKVAPSHAEPAQVVRYLPGQRYNKHHDYFDPSADSFLEKTKIGGQRLTTTLVYLKEPETGGRTYFPKIPKGFDPKVGDALLWWNVTDSGKEDPMTLHAGEPVVVGEKWALNLWLREKPNRKSETETENESSSVEKK